ncbi:endonuclease NucS [Candidatus Bathyarchaeota archaeon]|nr:endonuclease NucS [Candidatus Bathyarchaeota archaeon]MCK4482679.1 endonuclease NucS [Candidatus Bathyarchaeota archaeon]
MLNSKPFTVLVKPSVKEAANAINAAVSQRRTILVIGNCWVHYSGRASSKLEPGERILIIKEDGSLLVHRSVGYEPVNWQPPGCIFHIQAKDNALEIHAVRRKPAESVKVFFDEIHMVSALSLVDSGEFSLYASEEDMQKAVLLEPSLVEEGFKPISYEKKVEPGFVDVYGVDKNGNLVVVEIKRKTAGNDAALQLAKYVDAIKSKVNREVRGILVAPNIAKGVQRLLATLQLDFKALDPQKCAGILKRSKTRKLETFFKKD